MANTIISDLGGVLYNVNFQGQNGLIENLIKHSRQKTIDASRISRLIDLADYYEKGKVSSTDFHIKVVETLDLENMDYEKFSEIFCDIFSLNTETLSVYLDLRKTYRLVYLTNINEMHFDYLINNFGLLDFFEDGVASHQVGYRKPEKEVYLSLLKKINVDPR